MKNKSILKLCMKYSESCKLCPRARRCEKEMKEEEKMRKKKFKNYKDKQRYYADRSEMVLSRYDSGKRVTRRGEVRIKGMPYVKPKQTDK